MTADAFDAVIGQEAAVNRLRAASVAPVHAYVFLGPRGAGKRRAARAFAAELVGDPVDRDRARRLCATEEHPDLVIFEPEGTSFRAEEADAVIVEGSRSPAENGNKVILIDRFHDATPEAAAKLLKPIEEPPARTKFVLLAEDVPPEHVTIASRSTVIDFPAVTTEAIERALVSRGVDPDRAHGAAVGSGGDVGRAELLVVDDDFAARRDLWFTAPDRLDRSGHSAATVAREIRAAIDAAQAPLDQRHVEEQSTMDEVEAATGTRGSGRRAMEARHRREARLHRNDEWRMGLATLSQRYRREVVDGSARRSLDVFGVITDASEALIRNPNEDLWLHALLVRLARTSNSPG